MISQHRYIIMRRRRRRHRDLLTNHWLLLPDWQKTSLIPARISAAADSMRKFHRVHDAGFIRGRMEVWMWRVRSSIPAICSSMKLDTVWDLQTRCSVMQRAASRDILLTRDVRRFWNMRLCLDWTRQQESKFRNRHLRYLIRTLYVLQSVRVLITIRQLSLQDMLQQLQTEELFIIFRFWIMWKIRMVR